MSTPLPPHYRRNRIRGGRSCARSVGHGPHSRRMSRRRSLVSNPPRPPPIHLSRQPDVVRHPRELSSGLHTLTLETNPGTLNQAFLFDYVRIFPEDPSISLPPTPFPSPSTSSSSSAPSPTTSTSEPSPTSSSAQSAPQTTSPNANNSGRVPIGPVVGGAVGGGIALVLIAFALAFFLLRRKRPRNSSPEEQSEPRVITDLLMGSLILLQYISTGAAYVPATVVTHHKRKSGWLLQERRSCRPRRLRAVPREPV